MKESTQRVANRFLQARTNPGDYDRMFIELVQVIDDLQLGGESKFSRKMQEAHRLLGKLKVSTKLDKNLHGLDPDKLMGLQDRLEQLEKALGELSYAQKILGASYDDLDSYAKKFLR